MMQYERQSSIRARNTLSKSLYLKRIRQLLKADPQSVVDRFASLCKALHRPENFRIYVSADVSKLAKPVSAWEALVPSAGESKPLEPLDNRRSLLSSIGQT